MKIKPKFIFFLLILLLTANIVFASSSANYLVNDENLDFAYNAGMIESDSYALDLSGITWADRGGYESDSYLVIDANSLIGEEAGEPVIPPSGGTSGGGSGSGGYYIQSGEIDNPEIENLDIPQEPVLNEIEEQEPTEEIIKVEDLYTDVVETHEAAEELAEEITEDMEEATEEELIIPNVVVDIDIDGQFSFDGSTYIENEITTVWLKEGIITETFSYTDEKGEFVINNSEKLEDGDYEVIVYGKDKKYLKKIVEIKNGKAYVKDYKPCVKVCDITCIPVIVFIILILLLIGLTVALIVCTKR